MTTARRASVALALMVLTTAGEAQSAPPGCKTAMHRQFDFWVGDWTVTDSAGARTYGTNRVTIEDDGCTIHEQWTGAGPAAGTGQSLNAYDLATGQWGQDWVGSGGEVRHFRGGLRDGSMVLETEVPRVSGGTRRHRGTWTPQSDGRVRQRFEASDDGGLSWRTTFDGWYRKSP